MAYPTPARLLYPIEPYQVTGHAFGDTLPRYRILWMTHLGDDVLAAANTPVVAIGEGEVVYAGMHVGSAQRRNWGGLLVIGHQHRQTGEPFYSVYGHLHQFAVAVGQHVTAGHTVAAIAPGASPENGWRDVAHLHFSLYTGPWDGRVLPGWRRFTQPLRTRLHYWHNPQQYMHRYNTGHE